MPTVASPKSRRSPLANVLPFPPLKEAPASASVAPACKKPPAALVAALLAGDVEAQGELWDRYSSVVRAVLRRSLGPDGEVEDAVQEVFIQFFRSLPALNKPEAVSSFLIGIAVRIARSELRRRRIRRWFSLTRDGDLPEECEDERSQTGREQARRAVRRLYVILDDLDDESRMLFVLRYIERLELTEVASALGVSLATAKRKLARVGPRVIARARADGELSAYVADEVSLGGEVGS